MPQQCFKDIFDILYSAVKYDVPGKVNSTYEFLNTQDSKIVFIGSSSFNCYYIVCNPTRPKSIIIKAARMNFKYLVVRDSELYLYFPHKFNKKFAK